jgi:hypothetical protein
MDQHFIDILKQADWYYDFCDGLADWNKGKKTYDTAIKVLRSMTDDVQADLIKRYVPAEMQKKVLEDILK